MANRQNPLKATDYAQDATTYSVDHQIEELRQFKHEFKLSKGFVLQGRVVDWDGRPIEGTVLGVGELNVYRDKGPSATTGADGRYAFPPLARTNPFHSDASWPVTVTAVKRGYAPVMQAVPDSSAKQLRKLPSRERVVDFLLRKGAKVTLLVTDSDGLPLEGVWVIPVNWRDTTALRVLRQFGIPEKAHHDAGKSLPLPRHGRGIRAKDQPTHPGD